MCEYEGEKESEQEDQRIMNQNSDGLIAAVEEEFQQEEESRESNAEDEDETDESGEMNAFEFEEFGAAGEAVVEGLCDGEAREGEELEEALARGRFRSGRGEETGERAEEVEQGSGVRRIRKGLFGGRRDGEIHAGTSVERRRQS